MSQLPQLVLPNDPSHNKTTLIDMGFYFKITGPPNLDASVPTMTAENFDPIGPKSVGNHRHFHSLEVSDDREAWTHSSGASKLAKVGSTSGLVGDDCGWDRYG